MQKKLTIYLQITVTVWQNIALKWQPKIFIKEKNCFSIRNIKTYQNNLCVPSSQPFKRHFEECVGN